MNNIPNPSVISCTGCCGWLVFCFVFGLIWAMCFGKKESTDDHPTF